ncbi:MAG: T9SS type A sorting domain-containing protein, partial [Bacteroidetes bacterium]|nr:T9SS type A sorting domain-containing protein [Bacteroidota bacterium]
GAGTNIKTKLLETRLTSSVDNMVEAIFVHGVAGAGGVNIRSFSPSDHTARRLIEVGLGFDKATRYVSLAPDFHNLEITLSETKAEVGVFSLDLNGYQGETLIIAISGGANVSVMAVDANGTVTLPANVTSTEDLELPTEFSLHGNYPNPFNPSTRIQFDLPESAQVSLQVVDMLGREVMALPAQDFEAGSNRSIELNATNLASGTYLYRMIANGAESRYVKTGRMTLVK